MTGREHRRKAAESSVEDRGWQCVLRRLLVGLSEQPCPSPKSLTSFPEAELDAWLMASKLTQKAIQKTVFWLWHLVVERRLLSSLLQAQTGRPPKAFRIITVGGQASSPLNSVLLSPKSLGCKLTS